jgi:hypothetical protein
MVEKIYGVKTVINLSTRSRSRAREWSTTTRKPRAAIALSNDIIKVVKRALMDSPSVPKSDTPHLNFVLHTMLLLLRFIYCNK